MNLVNSLAFSLLFAAAACGGKTQPSPAPAPASADTAGSADPGDTRGIEAEDVAAMGCYEDCLTNGPSGGATGWADKSDDDRKSICATACPAPAKP